VITEYAPISGLRLGIGRLARREIDAFIGKRPIPKPPVRSAADLGIPIFGGAVAEADELLPIWDDPAFLADMLKHRVQMFEEELDLVAPAISLLDEPDPESIMSLEEAGLLRPGNMADLLRHIVLNDAEIVAVIELVFYNSTVTPRGLREAEARFDVQWDDLRLNVMEIGEKRAQASSLFSSKKTARDAGLAWEEFCNLTGPEQSEEVAFSILSTRLECLMAKRS